MGTIFLFLLAILSAILGLFVFMAYMYMFVFVGFIIASIAIFYHYGVGWGLAWLAFWWICGYLSSKR